MDTTSAPLQTLTAYLSWDHDRLDALLEQALQLIGAGEAARAAQIYAEFEQGLRRHIRIEEDLVFPLFEERTQIVRGPTVVMRHEHRQIFTALEHMAQAVERGDATAFRDGYDELLGVLQPHNMKEENVLYPMTDQSMSPADWADLLRRIEQVS